MGATAMMIKTITFNLLEFLGLPAKFYHLKNMDKIHYPKKYYS